ncbi:MAG: NAD(P)H-binding protein, partial [Immundisolibacteraceae bacterium]|nr:NAD(P)H-binding protein [Immundisolibacteraceae bacterium]
QLISDGIDAVAVMRDASKGEQLFGNQTTTLVGDVTQPESLVGHFGSDLDALFFTVDITGGIAGRGMFGKREDIIGTVYGGLVNTVDAAKAAGFKGRVVLLSTIGLVKSSWEMRMLGWIKKGLLEASIDKEKYLIESGLNFTIVNAGILTDALNPTFGLTIDQRVMALKGNCQIGRGDLAAVMIAAATSAETGNRQFNLYWDKSGASGRDIAASFNGLA